ncbi:MAG: hypothetical protein IKB64_02205 [Paludibacteraceae bacterium]|nr:hypothetical protein [Paludibacteraceae bacterium]
MKKILLAILLVACMVLFAACGKPAQTTQPEESADTGFEYDTEVCENVIIDIWDDNGGTYVLMSDVKILRSEGMIVSFEINDPAVLAFQVPDQYPDGVGTIDGREVESIIEKLMTILSEDNNLSDKTVADLEEILGKMKDVVVLTGAST